MSVCEQVCLKPPEIGLFYRGIGIPAAPVLTEVNPDESLRITVCTLLATLCITLCTDPDECYEQIWPKPP